MTIHYTSITLLLSILMISGIIHLSSGLCVGLTGLAAGYCIGIVGDQGVRSYLLQTKIFVGLVLILIFAEVLGLYGLIVGLILNTRAGPAQCWNEYRNAMNYIICSCISIFFLFLVVVHAEIREDILVWQVWYFLLHFLWFHGILVPNQSLR